jgi:hypothetical protein
MSMRATLAAAIVAAIVIDWPHRHRVPFCVFERAG